MLALATLCCAAWAGQDAALAPLQGTVVAPVENQTVTGVDAITIPRMLSCQGRLTDTAGRPLTDSTYSVAFRLYTVPEGGSVIWSETQNVTTRSGLFSVLLGSSTSIPYVPDGGALYLGMKVGALEMTPRLQIVSAAYAYKADTANYALAGAGGGGDNAWVRAAPDSVLFTVHKLGIARGGSGNDLIGDSCFTQVNLGVACTTGIPGSHGVYATVAGGYGNVAGGDYGVVAGGEHNWAHVKGGVGGGQDNRADVYAAVGGGCSNYAQGTYSTIGGGWANYAVENWATVGGGRDDTACCQGATVCGGESNIARGSCASVVGGYDNAAGASSADTCAAALSGRHNIASARYSFIGGGQDNTAGRPYGSVGGGSDNHASGDVATVGGGYGNTAGGNYATVAGGNSNLADTSYSTVGGGYSSEASGYGATVAGGQLNTASGTRATVGGGYGNTASGDCSCVPGGYGDTALAYWSYAANCQSTALHLHSAVFNGATTTGDMQTRVGILSKSSGSFTIDHPLDPYGKILNHYFIEGPEMLNVYRGSIVLDGSGRAEVQLPDYFDALNRSPHVQLTGVGTSEVVYVAEKVSANRFVIGGPAGTEVYWQVTGERKDVSAEATRRMMPVEQPKSGPLAGRMLDDEFISGCLIQLEREGKADGITLRTAGGRQRYEKMMQHMRGTGQQ